MITNLFNLNMRLIFVLILCCVCIFASPAPGTNHIEDYDEDIQRTANNMLLTMNRGQTVLFYLKDVSYNAQLSTFVYTFGRPDRDDLYCKSNGICSHAIENLYY